MELLNPCSKTDYPAFSANFTATAANTTAWAPGPQGVLVWSNQPCYVEVGVGATATTASTPIPANVPIPFVIPQDTSGAPWRVSAIRLSADGTIYCKPMNKN
jgi:hypothetical protein